MVASPRVAELDALCLSTFYVKPMDGRILLQLQHSGLVCLRASLYGSVGSQGISARPLSMEGGRLLAKLLETFQGSELPSWGQIGLGCAVS